MSVVSNPRPAKSEEPSFESYSKIRGFEFVSSIRATSLTDRPFDLVYMGWYRGGRDDWMLAMAEVVRRVTQPVKPMIG
jgi:hypothetical protein